MTAVRRVVVDTDTGIDDALALLYLARRPDVEITAVTAVFGNCAVDDALRNIGLVLHTAGLGGTPVARGANGPLDGGAAHIADYVHGRDGLGDLGRPRPLPDVVDRSAAELIVEIAAAEPGEHDLLVLGPATNVGLALRLDPLVLTRYRSTVVMGGSGPFPPLGVTQTVDANTANDPVAARAVYAAARSRLLMVGVNVGVTAIVDEDAVATLHACESEVGRLSGELLEAYMDFYQYAWGRRVSPAWDGLAAGLLVEPSWLTRYEDGPVDVVPDGPRHRAHLLRTADGRPVPFAASDGLPPTRVALDVDRAVFLADFVGRLAGRGTPGGPAASAG